MAGVMVGVEGEQGVEGAGWVSERGVRGGGQGMRQGCGHGDAWLVLPPAQEPGRLAVLQVCHSWPAPRAAPPPCPWRRPLLRGCWQAG